MSNSNKIVSLSECQDRAEKFIEQGNDLYRLIIDQYDFDGIYRPDLCVEDDRIIFSYLGKSPSLHEVEICQDINLSEIPFGSTDDEIEKSIFNGFSRNAHYQRERLKDNLRLGKKRQDVIDSSDIEHLYVDETYALLVHSQNRSVYEALKSAIEFAHNNSLKFTEGTHFETNKTALEECYADGSFKRTIKTASSYIQANQKFGLHRHNRILLKTEQLPETILEAVIGRPLGSVVKIHPDLDCKNIEKMNNTPVGVTIQFEEKLVNVGDFISSRG